jgi:hypothetical protein
MKAFLIILVAIIGQGPLFAQKANFMSLNKSPKVATKSKAVKLNTADISKLIADAPKANVVSRNKNNKVVSDLENITISGNELFYKLRIKNRSNIGLDVDFIRFYVRDLKTAKRTVTQEVEMIPVYTYGTSENAIHAKSSKVFVFAFEKFPLSTDKAFFIEVYERNGGRHQYLKVKPSDIFNARAHK